MKKLVPFLIATVALLAGAGAFAQAGTQAVSIAVPASSVDSGSRATVAIVAPNMSSYATKSEVSASVSSAGGGGWTKYFVGQSKPIYDYYYGWQPQVGVVWIAGDGSVVVDLWGLGAVNAGIPFGSSGVAAYGVSVGPSGLASNSSSGPVAWGVSAYYSGPVFNCGGAC